MSEDISLAFSLRILTSSHKTNRAEARLGLWHLEKDRSPVSVEIAPKSYRQDAAACVSLSKSTMSKTSTGFRPPRCLAPADGGGGLLESRHRSVNRSVRTFPPTPGFPNFGAKTAQGPPGGFPQKVQAIRLRLRKIAI